jgi:hypothetical protein
MTKLIVAFRNFANAPKNDDRRLSVFEGKIFCRINGAICEKRQWWKRNNRESEEPYNESNIVNVIKYNRLRWAGHVAGMKENKLPKKKIYYAQTLEVNEDVADQNQNGWRKTEEIWAVEIG